MIEKIMTEKIPQQFFWQIENFLQEFSKKYSGDANQKNFLDFSDLQEKYSVGATQWVAPTFQIKKSPNFTLSKNPVFTDEHGENFLGLKNFSLCFHTSTPLSNHKKPIYFVDNHQNALLPFFDFYQKTEKPITIVHIDAHRDDAKFSYPIRAYDYTPLREKFLHKILSKCRVSDYLDAGKKIGMIGEIFSVTQTSEFENFKNFSLPKTPYILNLDIDIYGPEGSAVDTKLKTEVISRVWKNADMVCFATSPAFIDQDLAARLGKFFYENL